MTDEKVGKSRDGHVIYVLCAAALGIVIALVAFMDTVAKWHSGHVGTIVFIVLGALFVGSAVRGRSKRRGGLLGAIVGNIFGVLGARMFDGLLGGFIVGLGVARLIVGGA